MNTHKKTEKGMENKQALIIFNIPIFLQNDIVRLCREEFIRK